MIKWWDQVDISVYGRQGTWREMVGKKLSIAGGGSKNNTIRTIRQRKVGSPAAHTVQAGWYSAGREKSVPGSSGNGSGNGGGCYCGSGVNLAGEECGVNRMTAMRKEYDAKKKKLCKRGPLGSCLVFV